MTTTTRTRFGEVTITIERPAGLPPVSVTPSISPKTEEEFHLAVEQLGGLGAASPVSVHSNAIWFYDGFGQGLMLMKPAQDPQALGDPFMVALASEQKTARMDVAA